MIEKPSSHDDQPPAQGMIVRCSRTFLSPLRALIWPGNFTWFELRIDYPQHVSSKLELALLDLVRASLELAACRKYDPTSRLERWKEAESALSWLMDQGWGIYAGSAAGMLVVLLVRGTANRILEVEIEWP
jgi:hypothetical protein